MKSRSVWFMVGLAVLAPLALIPSVSIGAPEATVPLAIVYVDLDRSVAEVEEGQEAQRNLAAIQQKAQSELQAEDASLARQEDEFRKKIRVLSQEALMKLAAPLQNGRMQLQQKAAKVQKMLVDKDRELFGPVEGRVKELLKKMANRDGYDLVLNKRSVPFGRKDLDVTDKLIQEYNRTYPGKGTAKPATSTSATSAGSASSRAR